MLRGTLIDYIERNFLQKASLKLSSKTLALSRLGATLYSADIWNASANASGRPQAGKEQKVFDGGLGETFLQKVSPNAISRGSLSIVGIGPGGLEHLTARARDVIARADVVVGYTTYMDLIRPLIEGKETFETGMTGEVERCEKAFEFARNGKRVAVISSGDSGIYGMAGLIFELYAGCNQSANVEINVEIEVVPGVPAFVAAAAVLGAPLMHDFASISLSDILTPWETIKARIESAAKADFVIALYNPRSRTRITQLPEAMEIVARERDTGTPVGIVRNATRDDERVVLTELGRVKDLFETIDMSTIIIIGNRSTFASNGRMITPRGYKVARP
jgi:precorrin-3B C17-methyltransferase